MLVRLTVRNYAIISELDVPFTDGLTIITGETGAGKSILIGALSLVLGKRADTSVLFSNDEKCVVEAHFDLTDHKLHSFFEENDLDYEETTILRREISVNGKSRAFVNDTPVNLNQLRELASYLIDIHSQHEVLTLRSAEFRTRFLDSCSDGGKLFQTFQQKYQDWLALKKNCEQLKSELQKATADEDYLRFQLNELEDLNLAEGEFNAAQERLGLLENAEEISMSLSNITDAISNSDNAIVDGLRRINTELIGLSKKFPKASEWQVRIHSNLIDLEDLSNELETNGLEVDADPTELQELQERVDEIIRLLAKHRKQSDTELIELKNKLESELEQMGNSDEKLTLLLADLEIKGAELEKLTIELSEMRTTTAKSLSPLIASELKEMGMPDAQLSIELCRTEIGPLGQDAIDVKFTSNKGQALQDISKVASGGELSRLMLAVKSEIAKNAQLPAIIFDEIDTGVSGDIANRVGAKIRALNNRMQVFCITHLPQIASKADQHLFVFKELVDGKTITNVKELSSEDRIVEIAKMLSNANPTEAALIHAKNMIKESERL